MEVTFAKPGLKKICEEPRVAARKLGPASAQKLQRRLADLMAAARLGDLPAGNPHPLKGSRAGQCSVRLAGGDRLVFEPDENPIPVTDDGDTDWKNIVSVRIVFIGDYHD